MWTFDRPKRPGFYAVKNSTTIDGEIEIIRFYPGSEGGLIDRDGDTPETYGNVCQWADAREYLNSIGGN